jgi:hypothetical protein
VRSVTILLCALLVGCGAPIDVASSGGTTVLVTAASPTTSQSTSTVVPDTVAATEATFEVATTTTVIGDEMVTTTPPSTPAPLAITDASVHALAAVLGVDGELEHRDAEHGQGQCIGRLEPRGLCVNVPLWEVWQYWNLDAQGGPGASDDPARTIAGDLFAQLGVDPGLVTSVKPNGPLPQVEFSSGALVMVAEDGRIAMVIAPTSLLPAG